MYSDEIKIPKERIAVLVGTKGIEKRRLQKKMNVKIEVDSVEGDVLILGEESVNVYNMKQVIKAIGRGFNPEIAEWLLKDDYAMEIIDIMDYCRKSKNDLVRVRARLIGTQGKARKSIEAMTKTRIVVYGKTVCIIGPYERVDITRQAIVNLLNGAPHSHVYKYIMEQNKLI